MKPSFFLFLSQAFSISINLNQQGSGLHRKVEYVLSDFLSQDNCDYYVLQDVTRDFYFYKEEFLRLPNFEFKILNDEGFIEIEKPSSVSKDSQIVYQIDSLRSIFKRNGATLGWELEFHMRYQPASYQQNWHNFHFPLPSLLEDCSHLGIDSSAQMERKELKTSHSFEASFPHSNLKTFYLVAATTFGLSFWALFTVKAAIDQKL